MSWSVPEKVSTQTATEMPLAAMALSDSSWSLRTVVLATNSLPSDRSWRPSRASSWRRRRGRRGLTAARAGSWLPRGEMRYTVWLLGVVGTYGLGGPAGEGARIGAPAGRAARAIGMTAPKIAVGPRTGHDSS